jgi:hypothetical protein
MIKDALDFLARIQTPKNPVTVTINDRPYAVKADGTIGEHIRKPDTTVIYPAVETSTLTALVGIYLANLDGLDQAKVAVHVIDYLNAAIIDLNVNEFGYRHIYARAHHSEETDFEFDTFYLPEEFLIKFRASFYFNEEAAKVQQLCSTLEAGSTVSVSDDGMSQTVVITSGAINKTPVTLPAEGVPLIPWRTFRDAAPVESKFLLRMKTFKDGSPKIALFEIDEKWKLDVVGAIRDYLKTHLPEGAIIFA